MSVDGDVISRADVLNIVSALLIPLGEPLEDHAAQNFNNGVRHAGKFLKERITALPAVQPVAAGGEVMRPSVCIHCDPSFLPTGPDGYCYCRCHVEEMHDPAA